MRIDGIDSIMLQPMKSKSMETHEAPGSFGNWMGNQITATNDQLNAADNALNDLASGRAENLHQTMLTLEQAKLSFQYLEQIRNRLMSAYQELLREQI